MIQKTADELIEAWDRGETILTIEMGGLGPGYEQAIQIAAVAFARVGRSYKPTGDDKADSDAFRVLCDAALKSFDKKIGGMSGAQYGAATWLAWRWCHGGGPEKLIADMRKHAAEKGEKDDRMIQCSRMWPVAPAAPPTEARKAV